MEWLEVRIVEQNECLSIKSRTEALDGDQFFIIIIIITIFIERTYSSKLESEALVSRWGTWLAGKGKEVCFETAFNRTNE